MTLTKETEQQAILTLAHHDFNIGLNARAYFKVGNHGTGEDLVQETFMKTWAYLLKGGKIDVMKAFLYHILNNLIIDEYRKNKTTSLDAILEKGFEPRVDPTEHLARVLDGKAAILLIARLPLTHQKVMRMRYVQDLSLAEMALITGKTKNAMAVQVHRGLERLKKIYYSQ